MKKFFYLLFSIVFFCFSTFCLTSCKKSEVEKVSKNLTTYAISAELMDNFELSATETIVYINNTGTELEFLCLHLYPRAFREGAMVKPYTTLTEATCFPNGLSFGDLKIITVKVNGEVKTFEHIGEDEDILKINFGFNLKEGAKIEITIDFILTIPNSTHRLGWFDNNINLGNWYPIICAFSNGEFDLTPYYSTGDPFFSEIANYDVEIIFDSNYELVSTGKINSTEKSPKNSQKNISKISAKAVRDFAICLSKNAKIVKDNQNNVEIIYMGYSKDQNTEKFLQISKDALSYFNNTFGEYPYSTLTVAKTPFIYGGMEFPNLVFISDAITDEEEFCKVIVHEIAHQWWYGIVGNNETTEAWLDESLSEYSTALFFKNNPSYNVKYEDFVNDALSSYLLYVDVIKTIKGEVNTKMNLSVFEYQNDYEYSYMVYVKGVIMFDSLSSMVGEKQLVNGLRKYYLENKFKIATKNTFYSALKKGCHKDLEGFFEGYLNGTTIISSIN